MNKRIKWILIGGILLCVSVLLIILLYLYTPVVDKAIISTLNSIGGQKFKVSYLNVSGNLFKSIRIDDILITFDSDTIYCKRVEFNYSVFGAIKNEFRLHDLAIIEPKLILNKDVNSSDSSEPYSDTTSDFSLPFDKFPDIQVDNLTLKDGSIIINNGTESTKIIDMQFSSVCKLSPDSINLTVNNCEAFWENRKLLVNNISFELNGNPSQLSLNKFQIENKHVDILANGSYLFQPDPRISLNINNLYINQELVKLFIPEFPYKEGYTNISGSLHGMPHSFSGNIYMDGVFDSLKINSMQTDVHREGNFIQLTNLDINSSFGDLHGDILVRTRGKNTATLSLSDINLKKIGLMDQKTSISGEMNFNFDNWDIAKLTGNGSIILPSLNIAGILIDSLKLNVVAESGNFAFKDPSKIVLSENSEFFLKGNLSIDHILELKLQTENNKLDILFDQIGMPEFKGGGELSLNLAGPFDNPDLTGHVILDSLTYSKVRVYNVNGNVDIKRIIENRSGSFNLDISSGEINKLKLTRGLLKFSIEKNVVHIDTVNFVSDQNNIFLNGLVSVFTDSINAKVNSLQLKYEDYLIQNNQIVYVNVKKDTLSIEGFELKASDYGSIKLAGMWAFSDHNVNATLQVINTRIEPFNQFFTWKYDIKGVLSADFTMNGDIYNPYLNSTIIASDLYLDNNLVGNVNSTINYQDQTLNIEKLNYTYHDSSYANLSGSIQLPEQDTLFKNIISPLNRFDLNLDISQLKLENYAFIFNTNFPLEGILSGKIDIIGTMNAPQGIVKLAGNSAVIEKYIFPKFNIEGRISPTKILVDKADINFLDTKIKVNGYKNINWNFNDLSALFQDKSFGLIFNIKEDSLNFLYAFIPDVDRIIGNINVTAKFGGDIDHPQLISGNVDIKNGDLYLTKIENPIRNINAIAHIDNKRLIIDQFKGKSPEVGMRENFLKNLLRRFFKPVKKLVSSDEAGGEIGVSGSIDFSILNHPKYNIDVSLNDAYFNYFLENTRVVVNSERINIAGRDTISIAGGATVKNGTVELDINESEKNVLFSKSARQTPPYIQYFLNVDVPDNFFIRSNATFNTFDIELSGNVLILQEPMGLLEMYGELNIIKGKYFIQFEDFDINTGSITFVNPKEYPELNLTAQKQKNNYLFDLTVTGPLNNPVKEMHTKNLETNEQIYDIKDQMALLVFGVRFQELSGLGQSAFLQKGEEVLAQTLINQFENEARYFTGLDRIRISTQENDETTIGIPQDEMNQVSTLALGKYIAPNLYLEYQTKLSYVPGLASFPKPSLAWESGNQIYLKYRITKNWSLSSYYQKTLRGNDKVQFDVNWQIDF